MRINLLVKIAVQVCIALLGLSACTADDLTPYLDMTTDQLQAPGVGKSFVVAVKSNRQISVRSNAEWCHPTLNHDPLKSDAGSLMILVDETDMNASRTANVTLSAEGCPNVVIKIVQDHVILNSEKSITSFSLKAADNSVLVGDIDFTYDSSTRTFTGMYLKWIDAENPEKFIPTFKYTGVEVLVNGEAIQSGKSSLSFADDFKIAVKAEDGSSTEYTVSLNCPQINTELPVLHMKPDQLIRDKDNYVKTSIQLYDRTPESTGEGWWDSSEKGKIDVRGRGNSTWILPKKPFRLKFAEKFSPIGLNHAKEKSWVILANDMDKSLLRTYIAFEYSRILFNEDEGYHHEKCLNFTPCSRFINVYYTGEYYYSDTGQTKYLDGEYLGVYLMSDQMERASGRIAVDKLEASDGNDPQKITGGYIVETDIHDGNRYTAKKNVKMTYKYPKDDDFDPAQYEYISNFLNTVEDHLYSSDFTNPAEGWRKHMDEKSLADFIIIKEFAGDMDGYTSTYMYKRRGYDKMFFGPVWDCDKGWDNDVRVPHSQYKPLETLMIYAGFWMPSVSENDWFQQVWKDEQFRKFVAARWASKKDELKAVTRKILDEIPAQMPKALEANYTVWDFNRQFSSEAKSPAISYEKELERILSLSERREALLDIEFSK